MNKFEGRSSQSRGNLSSLWLKGELNLRGGPTTPLHTSVNPQMGPGNQDTEALEISL